MGVKKQPKPLISVKHDFIAALDSVVHESTMLLNVLETLLKNVKPGGTINVGVHKMMEERTAAFRAALIEPLKLHDGEE